MKHNYILLSVTICIFALTITSCENNDATNSKFLKKHLIEDFSSQDCGYCPFGMDCINDYILSHPNCVLIRHQVNSDAPLYAIGDETVSNALGVMNAPCVAIDRTNVGDDNDILHYPNELNKINQDQYEATTYASINLSTKYDDSSRKLQIYVSGEILAQENKDFKLTVLIKESGVIDYQADCEIYNGWQKFLHTNTTRKYVTNALGNKIDIDSENRYSETYGVILYNGWIAQNCMVVAFLSEIGSEKIIQVEETPVVQNSSGGCDMIHQGILLSQDNRPNHILTIFSGFRCVTSLLGIEKAEDLRRRSDNKLILAVMHPASNPFTQGLYDYTCSASDEYYQYFGGNASTPFPTGNIDMKAWKNSYLYTFDEWSECLSSSMSQNLNVQIRAFAELSEDKKSIHVTSTARSDVDRNYQLILWLLEDGVPGVQVMTDGSVNYNFYHNYLLRSTGDNVWGLDWNISSMESQLFSSISIPEECNIYNCKVIVLLKNNETGYIDNSIQIPILGTSIK